MTRKEKILGYMNEPSYLPLMAKELLAVLDVKKQDEEEFYRLLGELEAEGAVFCTKKGRYDTAKRNRLKTGTFLATRKDFGFVRVAEEAEDYLVFAEHTKGALHGDTVQIRAEKKRGRPHAEVVRILEHKNVTVVGRFESGPSSDYVIPDDTKINEDIRIPRGVANGALHGHKVVCAVTQWGDARHDTEGKVTEILGFEGDFGVDVLSILRTHGFQTEFPDEVSEAARKMPKEISPDEIVKRRDLREWNIFTIDGADAKDLDDAVSVEKLENGNYYLGVHIADVNHYVQPKSAIDKEAYSRGTSVYLADRVVPMLPVELSNGICSLHGGALRLTLSCLMEITPDGSVRDYEIVESVISSKARMTYDAVTAILEEEPPELMEQYKDLVADFRLARELAEILRTARRRRGSVEFFVPEAKAVLDDQNRAVDILLREETVAHRIIEQFMLIANETVAEHLFWNQSPAIYRVHEAPSRQKMVELSQFLAHAGYTLKVGEKVHPKQLQQIMDEVKGKPEESVISTVMIRSMMKAEYSAENKGHFALASQFYCHFTSPIRRYPDLVVHRMLKMMLRGEMNGERAESLRPFVIGAAAKSSDREVASAMAERDTLDLKKAEYMENHVGEAFDGVISGVTSFGIFVSLPNTVEGLVRLTDIRDDYYRFDEKNYCLIGERTSRRLTLGDTVKIEVRSASGKTGEIDFVLLEGGKTHAGRKNRRTKQKGKA